MRAMRFSRYGNPDVLEMQELPKPQPAAGQVSIRVRYASINFADIMVRRGQYHVAQFPAVPGLEVSGVIHALGEGVAGLQVGQPVAALTLAGGYAEFALASAELTFLLDSFERTIDLAQAAALPLVGVTAYQLLAEVARVRAGETILIHAATGGVGSLAVQIARHLGAGQIIGTVGNAEKIAYARALGYDQVVLRADFVREIQQFTEGRGVDIILDAAGEPTRSQSLQLLAPFGRLVIFGNASNQPDLPLFPSDLLANNRAVLGYSFSSLTKRAPHVTATAARQVFDLLARGLLRIEMPHVLPLEQAAEAHRLIETSNTTGKLLLQI